MTVARSLGALWMATLGVAGGGGLLPAHENGRVELYVSELDVEAVADGQELQALVVDRELGHAGLGLPGHRRCAAEAPRPPVGR